MTDLLIRQSTAVFCASFVVVGLSSLRVMESVHAQVLSHDYVLRATEAEHLPSPPELPDLAEFSVESVRKKIPTVWNGESELMTMEGNRFLEESLQSGRHKDLQARQGSEHLRAIAVSGAMTLAELVEVIDDPMLVAASEDGVITLGLPILVRPGATFVIDGGDTPRVRLSTDRGAFLINAGTLIVVDAEVTSWDEEGGGPTPLPDPKRFRPFLASHIRSETYLAGSVFKNLGFAAPTSYGISLSSEPERERVDAQEDWPTGVLVSNEFREIFYGFYSYEARDVAVVGNRYVDCIKYGIDPHDRSARLIIARNDVSGTKERHGIIGSRGVSSSVIFDNRTHHNAGSGVMLDRDCTDNLVVGNRVHHNNQGIAVYESSSNTIRENTVSDNNRSAFRVRNSKDIYVLGNTIYGNGDYAFEVSQKELSDHRKRLEKHDYYEQITTVTIAGNNLADNYGLLKTNGLTRLVIGPVFPIHKNEQQIRDSFADDPQGQPSVGTKLGGDIKDYRAQIVDTLGLKKWMIVRARGESPGNEQ